MSLCLASLLALVVVACVLGGILLIVILAVLIYICVTRRWVFKCTHAWNQPIRAELLISANTFCLQYASADQCGQVFVSLSRPSSPTSWLCVVVCVFPGRGSLRTVITAPRILLRTSSPRGPRRASPLFLVPLWLPVPAIMPVTSLWRWRRGRAGKEIVMDWWVLRLQCA